MIVREFASSSRYRLIPSKQILNSAAYQNTPADAQAMLAEKMLIAKGYKYFWNGAKLGQLAEELGVDGVIVISAKFGYHFFGRKTGAFGIGLAAEGKTSPQINLTAALARL